MIKNLIAFTFAALFAAGGSLLGTDPKVDSQGDRPRARP